MSLVNNITPAEKEKKRKKKKKEKKQRKKEAKVRKCVNEARQLELWVSSSMQCNDFPNNPVDRIDLTGFPRGVRHVTPVGNCRLCMAARRCCCDSGTKAFQCSRPQVLAAVSWLRGEDRKAAVNTLSKLSRSF